MTTPPPKICTHDLYRDCDECIKSRTTPTTSGWEYLINAFYNDVVEAMLRFLKGKDYGENPDTFMKAQLGHWKENFDAERTKELTLARLEVLREVEEMLGKLGNNPIPLEPYLSIVKRGNFDDMHHYGYSGALSDIQAEITRLREKPVDNGSSQK